MPEMIGADPGQLRALGASTQRAANRLRSIYDELNGVFRQAYWNGGDAAEFRRLWSYPLAGRMMAAVEATQEAATALAANADQQERASGDTGGSNGSALAAEAGTSFAAMPGAVWGDTKLTIALTGESLDLMPFIDRYIGRRSDLRFLQDAADSKFVKKAEDLNGLKDLKIAKDLKGARAVEAFKGIGVVGAIGAGIDAGTLIYDIASHKSGDTKFNDVFSLALSVAAIAVGTTPVGLAILATGAVWAALPDGWKDDIDDGVRRAATDVTRDAVRGAEHVVSGTEHVISKVASGGVQAVESVFSHL